MSEKDQADAIIDLLLALPEGASRSDVMSKVRYNSIFCIECGYGSRDCPNPRCQCTNDE